MNVKFNGGGTFIFPNNPNTFVDLPKTRRVWAKRGVCANCYSRTFKKLYFWGCTRICPILSHLVVPGSGFVCCIACLPFLPVHHNLQRMSTFLCVITFFFVVRMLTKSLT